MIAVLRLGHRIKRDQRMTTHVALVSRALGADEVILSGEYDPSIIEVINKVNQNWNRSIKIRYEEDYVSVIKEYKEKGFTIVHLTMKGVQLLSVLDSIKNKDLLLIVGSQKVPPVVYKLSDYNVAVTKQPHSEVGALAITLNEITDRKYLAE